PPLGDPSGPKSKPRHDTTLKAGYTKLTSNIIYPRGMKPRDAQLPIPGRKFPKTQVIARSDNLLSFIEQLAQSMGLNVIFDSQVANQLRNAKLVIELRDVTYPKALEMILKTNNLMYAQLDTRTIVIALDNPQSRSRYDQLAVRTFYVKNADLTEVRAAIQAALPQTKGIVAIKQLNAIMVRDTPTNLELIESMIDSVDKSKAEVLIDVNIYEVTNNDLLQLGQQFNTDPQGRGNAITPAFLGGLGQNGNVGGSFARSHTFINNVALGFALGLPTSAISFFQNKEKAKLLASTQIHVLDNEANTVRIGQRVPIQTASFFPSGFAIDPNGQGRNNNQNNPSQFINTGFGGAFPQIQYENVGLNIDITPSVFEDDVQMKMKIESSSVDNPNSLTPTFSQRTMQSVARIKDGQTTLIAGVSQNTESKSVSGFPILGLIPILGRFFATPSTTNRQSDVVITVTPHILRRADIREEDHYARRAGTASDPSTELTIEQILYLADLEESQQNQVASAGGGEQPKTVQAAATPQIKPLSPSPPASGTATEGVVVMPPPVQNTTVQTQFNQPAPATPQVERKTVTEVGIRPDEDDDDEDADEDETGEAASGTPGVVTVSVRSAAAVAAKGQDLYVAVIVNGNAEISYTNLALTYDPNILDIKAVRDGGLLRAGGANPDLQFNAENGVLTVQMERPQGYGGVSARGQLLLLVFNVKGQGQSPLALNEQQTFFRTPSNQPVPLKLESAQIEVR
ncbi:MAG TPA: secretin N-terminal domain-containing protein, partial [Blastocatellia bacterium]|nr:secretin N-terminal domain-containing protein [Blastocatellia bacterium]